MVDTLNKYLVQAKSINIPGVGSIIMDQLSASTEFINKQINPPSYIYRFDKFYDLPGKEFFNYLSTADNVPDYEAMKIYNQFASDLRAAIKMEGQVLWKDVGYFRNSKLGEIEFQPLPLPSLYEPVAAERVLRNNASHAVLVGDKEKTSVQMTEFLNVEKNNRFVIKRKTWMIPAAILLAMALIILLVHFYNHGFSLSSAANQQGVEMKEPPAAK